MKLGRNDPCYCGSGKKYKHCHLEKDAQRERVEQSLQRMPDWMAFHAQQMRNAMRPRALGIPQVHDSIAEALNLAETQEQFPEMPFLDRQIEQLALYDVLIDGLPLVRRIDVGQDERMIALRSCLTNSYPSLIEVIESKRGRGVRLRDRLTGYERFVADPVLAARLEPMEVILGRLTSFNHKNVLLDGWEKMPFRKRKALIQTLLDAMDADHLPALPEITSKPVAEQAEKPLEEAHEEAIEAEEGEASEAETQDEVAIQEARNARAVWLKTHATFVISTVRKVTK